MIMVQENTALKNITYEWQKKMKTRHIFPKAISVVIIGEGGNLYVLNEIEAKGVR